MKGIMITGDIVMILTMKEVVGEIVTGEDVNLGNENGTREVLVGKERKVHTEGVSILLLILVLVLVVVMIGPGHGLLEVGVMVKVTGKTVMMTVIMIEVKDEETVKIDISTTIILLYVPCFFRFLWLSFNFLQIELSCSTLFIGSLCYCCGKGSFAKDNRRRFVSDSCNSFIFLLKSAKTHGYISDHFYHMHDSFFLNQAEWGPLRHVRVIKERNSGVSRGFAFIDFPSVVQIQVLSLYFKLSVTKLRP